MIDKKFASLYNPLLSLYAEAAAKAFDAKVKESDDFVKKMKKEMEQAEKRAKGKKALEKKIVYYKKAIEENEASIAIIESDLQKSTELREKEQEGHKVELKKTHDAVKTAEEYCVGRFASFSEMLSSKFSCAVIEFALRCFTLSWT